jgi:hypothetical protein
MIDLSETENAILHSDEMKAKASKALNTVVPNVTFRFWGRFLENSRSILLLIRFGFINEAMAICMEN